MIFGLCESPRAMAFVVDPLIEPEPGEQRFGTFLHLAAREVEEFHRHAHVLKRGERFEQVVCLEDEPQLAPYFDQLRGAGAAQFVPQHVEASFLHTTQRTDER
jgi:hypothetical protein